MWGYSCGAAHPNGTRAPRQRGVHPLAVPGHRAAPRPAWDEHARPCTRCQRAWRVHRAASAAIAAAVAAGRGASHGCVARVVLCAGRGPRGAATPMAGRWAHARAWGRNRGCYRGALVASPRGTPGRRGVCGRGGQTAPPLQRPAPNRAAAADRGGAPPGSDWTLHAARWGAHVRERDSRAAACSTRAAAPWAAAGARPGPSTSGPPACAACGAPVAANAGAAAASRAPRGCYSAVWLGGGDGTW